ncbi:Aste57867_16566 [Aphanomyces stellatus]|uniref:Aste57867_16562 protein n=1 Tax=Aphanomyces stellatus TaxID=120398 RepID=A0A485L6Z4_9STRA|nr:hypothetical protein As57867_016505 [Aphanomyces stellatus]KAF0692355.1 hypothetical protein As57867_016509 [Aphanomyces stellatus]VFT93335.1 Aste57867_16562 [Aphanomyces stellatus]VFT93339.1 Aste57867_16566 [Aphanomyces stellatus]
MTTNTSSEVNVRLTVSYPVPLNHSIPDVLDVFRGASWVQHVVGQVIPYLKSSTPAKKDIQLASVAVAFADDNEECSICMASMVNDDCVALACDHRFHRRCVTAWLNMKSTCPTCRFQYENEFAGKYTFRAIETTLVVDDETRLVSGQVVQAIVHATLAPVDDQGMADRLFPFEILAKVGTPDQLKRQRSLS